MYPDILSSHPGLIYVLSLLVAAILMFVIGKPRVDVVALIMIVALPLTGVITVREALAGFSDPNIVLVAALFVLGEGLVRTGVARHVGDWLIARSGTGEVRLLVLLMGSVALMGSVMNATAVVAIFIPIVLRVSQGTGLSKSRLLMPTSVAALFSGMQTLVATTPNLIVNGELVREGEAGFGFFTFTPIGLPLLVLGIVYMLLTRRLLGTRVSESVRSGPSLHEWIDQYRLHGRAYLLQVGDGSPLIDRALGELGLNDSAARVIAVERRFHRFRVETLGAVPGMAVRAGDVLLIDVEEAGFDVGSFCAQHDLRSLPTSEPYFAERTGEIGMAEALVPANSHLVGSTARESVLLQQHGVTVVGLRRGRITHEYGLQNEKLKIGDTLLVIGPWRALHTLRRDEHDLVALSLPAESQAAISAPGRAPHAVLCMLLVVALMLSGKVPNVQAALAGCLLMGLFGCISIDGAYDAIQWRSILLIVGMLPFSVALQHTGGIDMAADMLLQALGGAGIRVALASVFVTTAVVSLVISNTATAVLMAPVAIAVARHLHASPYPFAMMVALASSAAFMAPVSSPVNTMVSTAGNYSFGDFARIGVPLCVAVMILSVILVPWLLPPY